MVVLVIAPLSWWHDTAHRGPGKMLFCSVSWKCCSQPLEVCVVLARLGGDVNVLNQTSVETGILQFILRLWSVLQVRIYLAVAGNLSPSTAMVVKIAQ